MKFEKQNKSYFLVKDGIRVLLNESDLRALRVMTPMSRQVQMRRKALALLHEDESDPEATLILELVRLPTMNWAFEIPNVE